jgi:hypothetical protein
LVVEAAVSGKRMRKFYRFYRFQSFIAPSILTMRFSNARRMLRRTVLAALIASPGSVSGEETTVRFGHPGIGLDNREY